MPGNGRSEALETESLLDEPSSLSEATGANEEITTATIATAESAESAGRATFRNLETWREALRSPENFIPNKKRAEAAIAQTEAVKMALTEEQERTGEANLHRALLRLRLPDIPEDRIDHVINSPSFNRLWSYLLIFEHLFIYRISGVPYLLQRISKEIFGGIDLIGSHEHEGSTIAFDVSDSAARAHEDGADAACVEIEQNIHAPFFEILRHFPSVQFIKTIGDDTLSITLDIQSDEDIACMQALSARIGGTEVHVGIGKGKYEVLITPYGKIMIGGPAWEAMRKVQKSGNRGEISVTNKGEVSTYPADAVIIVNEPPKKSAMHFFNGAPQGTTEELSKAPEKLADAVFEYMARMGCTTSPEAVQMERPVERKSTCICITAPRTSNEAKLRWEHSVLLWEEQLEQMARRYDAKVVHIEVNPEDGETGEKMAILAFGALGSSPFQQEERSLRCIQKLSESVSNAQIGAEEGDLYISDTSQTREHGGALLTAVRAAFKKAEGDHQLGSVRLGPDLVAQYESEGITIASNGHFVGRLPLKGLGTKQLTTLDAEKMRLPETETRYVRTKEVKQIAAQIIAMAKIDPGTHRHLDIIESEEYGLGLTRILKALGRELRESGEQRMETARIPNFRDTKEFSGVAAVITSLFPTEEDFREWMDKNKETNKMWISLYKELQGEETQSNFRGAHPRLTERILIEIFTKIGELCVVCEDFEKMDELSKALLKTAPLTLVSTGAPKLSNRTYSLEGVDEKEISAIAAHTLGGEAPKELVPFIVEQIGESKKFNPTAIERMIAALRKSSALRQRGGTWRFNPERAPEEYTSLNELLLGIVRQKTDQAKKNRSACELLQTAVVLNTPCSLSELRAAHPEYTEEDEAHLVALGILRERKKASDPIAFEDQFSQALAKQELGDSGEIILERLKSAAKTGEFPTPHYLEICGGTGNKFSSEAIQIAATHAAAALERYELATTMEICGKMLGSKEVCRRVEEFSPTDIMNILSLYSTIISTKLLTGQSTKKDQKRLNAFISAVELEIRNLEDLPGGDLDRVDTLEKIVKEADGLRKMLATEAAFVGQNFIHQSRRTTKLEAHYAGAETDPETTRKIRLAKARLFFREADQHKGDKTKKPDRIKAIDSAIELLEELDSALEGAPESRYAQEVKRDLLVAKGYKVSGALLPEEEMPQFGAKLTEFCEEGEAALTQYGENYRNHEWLLEIQRSIIQPTAMVGNMDRAIELTEALIERTRQNGLIQLNLKGVNFLLNLRQIELSSSELKTMPEISRQAEEAYQTFTKLTSIMSPEEREVSAQTILASHLTRFESIVIEAGKLAALKEEDAKSYRGWIQTSTETIMRGQDAIQAIQESREQYGETVANWDEAIKKQISTFDELKKRLRA